MLFGKKNWKNLDAYKILDTVNLEKAEIDFEKALKSNHILHCSYTNMSTTCAVLYEDTEKIYYHYHAQYAYRLFCVYKAQKKKAVYLGYAGAFACYFHDKIFTIGDGELSIGNHYMLMIDPKTGKRQGFDFLGKGVITVSGLGMTSKYCQDWIVDMKGGSDAITLKIRRRKADLPAGVADSFNMDMDYLLQIQYQNGQFAATRVSPETIIRKGPWSDSERSPWGMDNTKPSMGELTEADKALMGIK